MYIATSVAKPAGISPGSASPKKANVTIFDMDDVAFFPVRDAKGIVISGNILMKPGKRMVQVYSTRSKISAPYESDGDEDSINVKPTVDLQHPGNKKEGREFIQNWLGKNVGLILETCDGQKELVGTPCAPLQLKPSKQDNNDGLFHMLKFEAFASSNLLPALYEGELALGNPIAVTVTAPMGVNTGLGNVFKLGATDTTSAIAFVWSSIPNDGVFTVIGSGGDGPLTLTEGPGAAGFGVVSVLLKGGIDWTALDGAHITLKAFSGGGTNYFIEQSRG